MKHPKSKYANDVIRERSGKFPTELIEISQAWETYACKIGDVGSCVLGAGFLFKYRKKWYFLSPPLRFQGSVSWETNKADIEKRITAIGVTNLRYEWGNVD